ncbi:MAG: hypothetical protein SVR94_10135 [Pseudomonadota bacterium]|nr:hypothetical protein [Pseudomonadota bacterium]
MISKLNTLGQRREPFLFIIDFEVKNFYVAALTELAPQIFFDIDGVQHLPSMPKRCFQSTLKKSRSVGHVIIGRFST